jgi:hypothetical protein
LEASNCSIGALYPAKTTIRSWRWSSSSSTSVSTASRSSVPAPDEAAAPEAGL